MRPLEIMLLVIVPALLLILSIWHYSTHLRLIRHFKSAHVQLWRDLGEPSIVGALLTGGTAWSIWSAGKQSYVGWLWRGGYRELHDSYAESLGTRLSSQTWIAIGLLVMWSLAAWLGGYGHIR
jgi:hypothetical protein